MQYALFYIIEGKDGNKLNTLKADIAERFNFPKSSYKSLLHITLKYDFIA